MPPAASRIINIGEDRLEEATDVLAQAFHDYPLTQYVFEGSAADYRANLRASFRLDCVWKLALGWPFLGALGDAALVAVALVEGTNPTSRQSPLHEAERALLESFGERSASRLRSYAEVKLRHKPRQPHLYLEALGVLPGKRGEGHAGRLLRTVHEISKSSPVSTGVALDTQVETNLPLYRRFGYEVIDEAKIGPVPVWFMFRANHP